jgi:hypothetical protein
MKTTAAATMRGIVVLFLGCSMTPLQQVNGQPPPTFPLLMSAGETDPTFSYTDSKGAIWGYDRYYGGTGTPSNLAAVEVVKTNDDRLYQKQRFGTTMQYSIPAPPGDYRVTLYLAELTLPYAGTRVFDIVMENVLIQDNFDMVAFVGRRRSAILLEQDVTVTDGMLEIAFVPVVGIPTVAAIRVDQYVTTSSHPSLAPSDMPSDAPSVTPSHIPVHAPSRMPSIGKQPSGMPSRAPSTKPSRTAPQPLWTTVNNTTGIIRKRHEACFVMVREKGYLLGGRGVQKVSRFDPATKQWSDRASPPIELHHMQCVAVDDAIFIVSSWTGYYPNEVNTEYIYIYNTTANVWSTRPGLPEPRRRGGAAQVLVVRSNNQREIYVSHGNRGGHGDQAVSYGWLDKYNVDLNQWTTNLPDAPNPRDHTGGGLVQNGQLLCVAGGRDGGVSNFFNTVVLPTDCYNLATGIWSVKPNIPQGRAGSSYGRTCDGKLMVAGGEGFGQAWSNVDVFDGTSWKSLKGLQRARHGSGLAVSCICNEIYIASGSGSQGGSPELTTTERYLPVGSTCS